MRAIVVRLACLSRAAALCALAAACGGKVVVDPVADGASEATTGAGAAASSSATGVDCASLRSAFLGKLGLARQCAPEDPTVQCSGSATVPDECGCTTIVNEQRAALVADAQSAYSTWVGAGCGPDRCAKDCLAPSGGFCAPQPDAPGICQASLPD